MIAETKRRSLEIKMDNSKMEAAAVPDVDAADLLEMGYVQELRRDFSMMQLLGSAYSLTNSWIGIVGGFTIGISTAGPVSIVYGLIIMFVINIFVAISLSELMSAMPNSGGQYFWALKLSPKKYARISAFVTGVFSLCGAFCGSASACVAISQMILGMVKLANPAFNFTTWEVYLLTLCINLLAAFANCHEALVTRCSLLGLWISLISVVVITVTVPSKSPSYTSANYIFSQFQNGSGWSSTSMAFLLSLINANYAFGLLDTATHLAEETPNPARNVPKAIIYTVLIGFVTSFPLACVLMYCLTDYDAVAGTATGIPLLELFYIALGRNKGAAIFLQALVVLTYFFCLIAVQTYQARIIWSFSRDGGLPFSHYWSQVNARTAVPLNAHALGLIMTALLCILSMVSTTAFTSLVIGVVTFPYLSYILPMAYSLWRLPDENKGPFNLGRVGVASRVITLAFCLYTIVIYSFPYVMPVTAGNMNYISAITGIVGIWILGDWSLRAHSQFKKVSRTDEVES